MISYYQLKKKLNKKVGMSQNWAKICQNWQNLVKIWYYVYFETKKYIKKYKFRLFQNE